MSIPRHSKLIEAFETWAMVNWGRVELVDAGERTLTAYRGHSALRRDFSDHVVLRRNRRGELRPSGQPASRPTQPQCSRYSESLFSGFVVEFNSWIWIACVLGNENEGRDRDPRGGPGGARGGGGPPKVLPIEIPAIPFAEFSQMTNNFSDKALVGEGSYGRVFRATLKTGEEAAIKKLDPSASNEPDNEFAAQVIISFKS